MYKDLDKKRAYEKKFYHEKYKEKRRKYYQENREYILARQRAYNHRIKQEKLNKEE